MLYFPVPVVQKKKTKTKNVTFTHTHSIMYMLYIQANKMGISTEVRARIAKIIDAFDENMKRNNLSTLISLLVVYCNVFGPFQFKL